MGSNTLLSPQEVAQHVEDAAWVVVDCRFDLSDPEAGRRQYAEAHVPRALYAHLDEDLSGRVTEETGRHPLPDPQAMAERLSNWGVGPATQVVAYDAGSGAMASRLWWLLRWLGHEHVAVMDGGLAAWRKADYPLSAEARSTTPAVFTPKPEPGMYVTAEQIEDSLWDGSLLVLDARSPERFRGEAEPIDPVAGHIPGALNRPFTENVNADGTFKSADSLRQAFELLLKSRAPEEVVSMCGSGVTACHNLLAMHHAGLPGGRLYPGSWSEWITHPQRPVATDGA